MPPYGSLGPRASGGGRTRMPTRGPAAVARERLRKENAMARYPDISDHGLIGDLQTAALVTKDGTVDWFCCPRFDSPSVFASLLDADPGGYFRIGPDTDRYVSRQPYFPSWSSRTRPAGQRPAHGHRR